MISAGKVTLVMAKTFLHWDSAFMVWWGGSGVADTGRIFDVRNFVV